ncbi:MAG: hypothetical protein ABI968_00285 [Acidobacteriota bacterium]
MVGRGRDQHQPEPWAFDGRSILNASGWILAKTIFESDARRIVAAVNDVLAIPTAALEAGFIREILVPRSSDAPGEVRIRIHPLPRATDPAEFFIHDRRAGERREGERRRNERRRGVSSGARILSIADGDSD